MPFGMILREPQNHFNDCYFCYVNLSLTAIRTGNISYPDDQSTSRSIPYSDSTPVTKKPGYWLEEIHTDAEDIMMTYALYIKITTFFNQHQIYMMSDLKCFHNLN